MNELISIIVPGYNVQDYLEDSVNSIIKQTYKNFELILVDDGSTDGSPAIFDACAKKDKRIKVIHKKNGGLSDARNAGLKITNGELITFIDSDDTVGEDYLKQMYATLKKYNADIAICGHTAIYGDKKIEYSSNKQMVLNQKEALKKILYHEDFNSSSWAKLYKRELFDGIEFPVGKNYEDTSTTYKLILKSKKIGCNLKSQYNYIIRKNSIMTHAFNEKDLMLIESWDTMARDIVRIYPDLEKGAIRGKAYARICTLRKVVQSRKAAKSYGKSLRRETLKFKNTILADKLCPKRDKIAMILLSLGLTIFKFSWNLYCRFSGRVL